MKKDSFFRALVLVNTSLILILGIFFFKKTPHVVYVDSVKLLSNFKGMIDAKAVYQKKAAAWKSNIDTLANEVHVKIIAYEKTSASLTAKERQLSQELIRTKQKQLSDYQQALNSQAQQEDTKMTSEVLLQVNAFLKKYGETHGYTIILAATQYGNLAYADESLDITEDILDGLNKEYNGK